MKNIIIGIVAALLSAGLIIYAIEQNASISQVLIGFLLFVLPTTFISSFKSKVAAFILAFVVAIFSYIVIKNSYHDVWPGALLAIILGGSAFYFRVRKYKPFSSSEYAEKSKSK